MAKRMIVVVEMDNAAFDNDWREEAARILQCAADEINKGEVSVGRLIGGVPVKDINGNRSGIMVLTMDEGDTLPQDNGEREQRKAEQVWREESKEE